MKLRVKNPQIKINIFFREAENRNLFLNIIGTISIKGIAMFLTLFTMPSYIKYFQNNTVLGVWFSLVAILNWILTFDLGIGNGLRNHLVPALNSNDSKEIKKLISSSYFFLGILSVVLAGIGSLIIKSIDLNKILNINPAIISDKVLELSVLIVFIGVIVRFFLQIITSIFYAMQKTVIPNVLTLISSILILVFVNLYRCNSVETKLLSLALAQSITLCLPLFIATIAVFCTILKEEKPSFSAVNWKQGKRVVGLGGEFFIVQICLLVITSTNDILISNLTSPEATVEFQVYNRIFYTIITMFSLLTQPMWSAFSQANSTKNYQWIKTTYQKFNRLAWISTVFSFGLALVFKYVVFVWLGKNSVSIHLSYSLWFAVLISINLFINASTCVANGLNELKCQIIGAGIGAVLKIPLSILLVNIFNTWIGVIIANVLVLIPMLILQLYDSNKKLNMKISAMQNK